MLKHLAFSHEMILFMYVCVALHSNLENDEFMMFYATFMSNATLNCNDFM